ncbi:MAG TPA: acyltransferase [Fimbriimonadaceae bacterium]|nr:acyltransferase [Fimbriimonadaceae bacterium]
MEQAVSVSPPKGRDEAFDIAKGLGIVAVVALHLSSRSASLFHKKFDPAWWTLHWINLFLNFCVPLFLLISAILLARSAVRSEKTNWARFAWRRTRSVIVPLIVWSAIFWVLRAFIRHDSAVMEPGFWTHVGSRLRDLAFGKAEFHLYFLSILAQFCLVLPFLVLLFRRVRSGFWPALILALSTQSAAFALQKVVRFQWPGSTVFWYLSILVPGVWLGMNWKAWPTIRRRTWIVWGALAIAGFVLFGYGSARDLQGLTSNGTLTNAAGSAYALGASFLIIGLLTALEPGPRPQDSSPLYRHPLWGEELLARRMLKRMGELSIQIYLMHPILMQWLSTSWRVKALRILPVPSLWLFLITLFGTYGIALLLDRLPYVNQILFGKER